MLEARPSDIDDIYMTAAEVASRLRLSVETLANARSRGEGMPWTKIHGRVLYRMADVLDAEAAGSEGFTWARLERALASYEGLSVPAREKVMAHLRRELG